MPKPSRRQRKPKTIAPVARPAVHASLFLGIRRAIFSGGFAKAVAEQARETTFSGSIGSGQPSSKHVDFFARVQVQPNSLIKGTKDE